MFGFGNGICRTPKINASLYKINRYSEQLILLFQNLVPTFLIIGSLYFVFLNPCTPLSYVSLIFPSFMCFFEAFYPCTLLSNVRWNVIITNKKKDAFMFRHLTCLLHMGNASEVKKQLLTNTVCICSHLKVIYVIY